MAPHFKDGSQSKSSINRKQATFGQGNDKETSQIEYLEKIIVTPIWLKRSRATDPLCHYLTLPSYTVVLYQNEIERLSARMLLLLFFIPELVVLISLVSGRYALSRSMYREGKMADQLEQEKRVYTTPPLTSNNKPSSTLASNCTLKYYSDGKDKKNNRTASLADGQIALSFSVSCCCQFQNLSFFSTPKSVCVFWAADINGFSSHRVPPLRCT